MTRARKTNPAISGGVDYIKSSLPAVSDENRAHVVFIVATFKNFSHDEKEQIDDALSCLQQVGAAQAVEKYVVASSWEDVGEVIEDAGRDIQDDFSY